MENAIFILGAADPEMAAIEALLRDAGVRYAYAVDAAGVRVHPGNAYRAAGYLDNGRVFPMGSTYGVYVPTAYLVECSLPNDPISCDGHDGQIWPTVVIDHHRPGDPGYGLPPDLYLAASSIGQVLSVLCDAGTLPGNPMTYCRLSRPDLLLVAAADHCLEVAYRSRCPGVDPDALMRWRAESRAAFQRRSVDAVLADIAAARSRLRAAIEPTATMFDDPEYIQAAGLTVSDSLYADFRGENIPELPEAAAREGIPFLADQTDRDGRRKVVLMAAPAYLVERFLAGEIVSGLTDFYGDPARGFAGGYLPNAGGE